MNATQPAWLREVASLLAAGEKLEAIRRYREETSVDLADAVQAIERIQHAQLQTGPSIGSFTGTAPAEAETNLETETLRLLQSAGLIAAIKHVRDQTQCGLKEAKDYVESLIARRHPSVAPFSAGKGIPLMLVIGFAILLPLAVAIFYLLVN